jgi:4-amino-4-deoxy-L-arabinose transferase-like glycosyltransferase
VNTRWPIIVVLLATSVVYFHALGTAPAYIGGDEARFATGAWSLATTGRDLAGNRLPLFFHMPETLASGDGGARWYQPLLFYAMAVGFRIAPFTEQSARMPSVVIGILDVFLIYGAACRVLGDRRPAILAALLLAFSPAHMIFSRQALDYVWPVPFALAWLWCLTASLQTGSRWLAFAAGAILGVGFYSYIASWVTMPLLLLLTWIAQRRAAANAAPQIIAATLGFVCPVLVAAVWLGFHPEMWRDTIGRYNVYDARHLSMLQGLKAAFARNDLFARVSVYWDYFNPAYLFFAGGSNLTMATRKVGVFLLPLSAFLICGLKECWRRKSSAMGIIVLGGLAVAPVPATLLGERYAIQRELVVLPFATLIATLGAVFLLRHQLRAVRLAGVFLLLTVPVQFAYFCQDYFNDYRIRSAYWFDPVNFRGVAEHLIAASSKSGAPIYLSEDLDDVAARWRFYLVKHQRPDLLQRTSLFAAANLDVRSVTPGSLLVLYPNDPRIPALLGPEKCTVEASINDIAGARSAIILQRAPAVQEARPQSAGSQ